jgi:hypothetical protein
MASGGQCNTLRSLLILSVAVLFVVVQTTESESVSFGENYGASSDEVHTRVEGGGSQVDLVLDHASGTHHICQRSCMLPGWLINMPSFNSSVKILY